MTDGRPRVFLSSTVLDLADLRSAVKFWLEEYGFVVLASEWPDFPHALDREAARAALSAIDDCDYYVLIMGTRRGSLFPGDDISVTRAEFRHAREIRRAGGRLEMLHLARKELVYASRAGTPPETEDPEWAHAKAFLDEVKASTDPGEPNWVRPFDSFRDVVDTLTATLRLSGPLRRRALEANLMHEIRENLKRGLMRTGQRAVPSAHVLPNLSVTGATMLEPVRIPAKDVWRVIFFRLHSISAGRMRSALEAAINSGEFLEYDPSRRAYRVGVVQEALLNLRTELTQIDHLVETMNSNKTIEQDFGRLAEAGAGKRDVRILGFTVGIMNGTRAAMLNSMNLGSALCRVFGGLDKALRVPELVPGQLSAAEAERVKAEVITDAEVDGWVSS